MLELGYKLIKKEFIDNESISSDISIEDLQKELNGKVSIISMYLRGKPRLVGMYTTPITT